MIFSKSRAVRAMRGRTGTNGSLGRVISTTISFGPRQLTNDQHPVSKNRIEQTQMIFILTLCHSAEWKLPLGDRGRQGATGGLRLGSDEIPVSYLNRKQVLSSWEQDSSLGAFLKKKKKFNIKAL